MDSIYTRMEQVKLVPVVKIEEEKDALPLARALREGGLPCMEITFRTGCAQQALRAITQAFPDMLVGAGTVLSPAQARQAAEAGAAFIVSPGLNPEVVGWCVEHQVPVLPGCATPSDVERAIGFGLSVVKFFPAENAGGLPMIRALGAPYGQMRFMPTGGINEKNLREYLADPRVLACGGSWMVKPDLIRAGRFDAIAEICRRAVALARGEKAPQKDAAITFPVLDEHRPLQVLAFGEPLLRLSAAKGERIAGGEAFTRYAGGAELNVAAGLAQLGLHAGILSRLAANPVGDYVRAAALQKGVDCTCLLPDRSPDARVGLYFTEYGGAPRKPTVVYDRRNSSFAGFSAREVPPEVFSKTQLFFTTGISMACAPNCRAQAGTLMKAFQKAGSLIAFDINYRANLWGEDEAREAIEEILPLVDILFVSEESSRRMFRKTGSLEEILRSYSAQYGISVVVTTRRTVRGTQRQDFGSLVYSAEKNAFFFEPPYENIEVTDRIGSGDAFVSGVLYGILARRSLQSAVEFGDAACAVKCTVAGDLPQASLGELEQLAGEHAGGRATSEMNR